MNEILKKIKKKIYDKYSLELTNFRIEEESKEYDACRFELNGLKIICRNSKITAKKVGQFVTFWKRDENKITIPHNEIDDFDFYVINAKRENKLGQFVFPKSELIRQGIISTDKKEGKRGFRVYPNWVVVQNKQAEKTQKWQLKFFYTSASLEKINELYGTDCNNKM